MSRVEDLRQTFRALHASGLVVMPNPADIGTALLLQNAGAQALATTSSGLAWTKGRADGQISREELVAHVAELCQAVSVPVNVDAEQCFPDSPGGIVATIELLAQAGAAGVSIEDYDPATGQILDLEAAVVRVTQAAEACERNGMLLTARAENHLHGRDDLPDTLARLAAYRDAGADCLYAPRAHRLPEIERIVALGLPVNVLAAPGAPTIAELTALGVRRVSTGGSLIWVGAAAMEDAVLELFEDGTSSYLERVVTAAERDAVLAARAD